jgi:peroxiredoxin family protein
LLNDAEAGGKRAASLLQDSTDKYIKELIEQDLPMNVRVVCRMYADMKGLADTCHRAGIVPSVAHVEEFARGFTRGKVLFDFIDVGPGKDRAYDTISGKL